jgi:molybdopterin-guanine dinucleotide biosynthesis protein A
MGSDKGLLNYNGKPQREFLFDLLGGTCAKVFTSCRKDQGVPSQLNPLPDHFHIPGPLNGILSAFTFKPESSWLTVAVDMPFVRASALDLLIFNRDKSKMATCFFNPETQQPEPLLTLWEASAYPSLLKFWEKGNISPRDFLKTHPARMIQPPDEKTLVNYNYPGELQ